MFLRGIASWAGVGGYVESVYCGYLIFIFSVCI